MVPSLVPYFDTVNAFDEQTKGIAHLQECRDDGFHFLILG